MLKIAYNLIFHYQLFRPTLMIDHFSQMKQIADKQNITYLVLDKDDTLVPVYQFEVKDKKIHDTLLYFHNTARFIIVISNSVVVDQKNRPPQIRLNNHQKFFDIMNNTRPKPFNGDQIVDLMKAQKLLNPSKPQLQHQKVAVVGDRLLTDIHLANLMGWKSYLVKPLEQTTIAKHGIAVWLMRHFENYLIKRSNFPKYNGPYYEMSKNKGQDEKVKQKQQLNKQK